MRGIEPRADVGLGHDREAVADAAQIAELARVERVQVVADLLRARLGEAPRKHLQLAGIELAHELGEADLALAAAQGAHGVSEVALGLAQVVGLGVALAGERASAISVAAPWAKGL